MKLKTTSPPTTTPKDRLKQIFNSTIESGEDYSGPYENVDFYSLICKSAMNDHLYKIFSCNVMMFNYQFKDQKCVLLIFAIPIILNENNQKDHNKHVSERIMEILKLVEETFITVEHMAVETIDEDKFTYMLVIKKVE